MTFYLIEGVNPIPWQPPKLGTGRRKGGGMYPTSYPVDEMVVYQHAVKDYMEENYKDIGPLVVGQPLMVTFWYWRCMNFGGQKYSKRVDVTNLNKCLEDSLQGVLFPNDRDNRVVIGVMMAQERDITPRIIIQVEPLEQMVPVWLIPPVILVEEHHG